MASSLKSHDLQAGLFSFMTIISFPLLPMLKWLRSKRVKAEIRNMSDSTFLCRELDMQQDKANLCYRDMLFTS